MYCVAGLDRGFAANHNAELAVEAAIYSLVGAAGGSPALTWTASAFLLSCAPAAMRISLLSSAGVSHSGGQLSRTPAGRLLLLHEAGFRLFPGCLTRIPNLQ